MNDSLDNMMGSPKKMVPTTALLVEESDELAKIKKKMKHDDQWRKMQLLFAKPLINDLNDYTLGDQNQINSRNKLLNHENSVLYKAYLVEAKPQGLSKIKRFKPYIEKDKEKIDKLDKDDSEGESLKLSAKLEKKTAKIPKVSLFNARKSTR